jgi:hypothetical protein
MYVTGRSAQSGRTQIKAVVLFDDLFAQDDVGMRVAA